MEVDVTFPGDVARVRIKGRIVDGKQADQLKQTLSKLLQDGKLNTIFDLWEVTWFDSLGIGILVAHYISVASQGGKVMLLGANKKIRQIVEMVRLAGRFGWGRGPPARSREPRGPRPLPDPRPPSRAGVRRSDHAGLARPRRPDRGREPRRRG